MRSKSKGDIQALIDVMQKLLGPGGCPWDREQTLESLRPYVIEEAHEVVHAIDEGSKEHLQEELGDLLLQIVFQTELTQQKGWFGLQDVVAGICDKLVRRHPHVFGDAQVSGSEEVLKNWEQIKAEERREKDRNKAAAQKEKGDAGGANTVTGALDGVPVAMPALLQAVRVGEKAARMGFDWKDEAGVRAKVEEELAELDEALALNKTDRIEEELGDLLFVLTRLGAKRNVDPEAALRGTIARFRKRFTAMESFAAAQNKALSDFGLEEQEALWQRAKGLLL